MTKIYLDHAATTPVDNEILQKMLPYFIEAYGNADSPHSVGRTAMNAVDGARDLVASLLRAKPSEIYFTSGGTEADNWAMIGGAYAQKAVGKAHVILSSIEHHAVLAAAEKLEKEGFDVTYLPVNEGGMVTADALKAALRADTGLVAVMAANNETGVKQPVAELVKLVHENGSLFFTDAVQLAPYEGLDVKALGVDLLSLSSHKFYGPKGCGVLYIKSGVKVEKYVQGGEQERGMRGGTTNVPCVVGLAAAYEKCRKTAEEVNAKLVALRALFLKQLEDLDGVHINGDITLALPSVVNLRFDGVNNVDFLYNMDLKGICVSAGSACSSASIKPSHVLTAMGLTEDEVRSSIRFSFGKNNTEADVMATGAAVKETVLRLRGM